MKALFASLAIAVNIVGSCPQGGARGVVLVPRDLFKAHVTRLLPPSTRLTVKALGSNYLSASSDIDSRRALSRPCPCPSHGIGKKFKLAGNTDQQRACAFPLNFVRLQIFLTWS